MPIQKSEAIVLRKTDLRETSLIVTFLTRDFGKIKGLIKGVRRPKSETVTNYECFVHQELVFYEKPKTDIYLVKESSVLDYFLPVKSDFAKFTYGNYMLELTDACLDLHVKEEDVFDLLLTSLKGFAEFTVPSVLRVFEIKLFSLLGFLPHLKNCIVCGEEKIGEVYFAFRQGGVVCAKCEKEETSSVRISRGTYESMRFITENPFEKSCRLKLGRQIAGEIEKAMREFIAYRLEKPLKTWEFIREIRPANLLQM